MGKYIKVKAIREVLKPRQVGKDVYDAFNTIIEKIVKETVGPSNKRVTGKEIIRAADRVL